ncbi:MAG: hypothetical protein AAF458_10680 [Pseudomonadota bacterium]
MDFDQFVASLGQQAPPVEANVALRALWYDANGRDDSAMRAAKSDDNYATLRVRAYLYRKDGDERAARRAYWQAGVEPWSGSHQAEWEDIARAVMIETIVERSYL